MFCRGGRGLFVLLGTPGRRAVASVLAGLRLVLRVGVGRFAIVIGELGGRLLESD